MFDAADRGDLGAVPDPSWEERWSTWSIEAIQVHIAGAARYGLLSKVQVDALLQGLPPPSVGAEPTGCVLAEFEAIVCRFWQDVERNHVAGNPTPRELAAWANARGHSLPDPFLASLVEQARPYESADIGTAPGGFTIALPRWAPLLMADGPPEVQRHKVGRPKTADSVKEALVVEGRRIQMAAASQGRYLRLLDVAKELEGTPVAAAKCATGIKRALSGKLDVKKAKAKASAVSAKAMASRGIYKRR